MLISYDFTGPAARIVGVKVTPVLQMICAHYRPQRTRKLYEAWGYWFQMPGRLPDGTCVVVCHILGRYSGRMTTAVALTKMLMLQVTGDDHVPAGKHTWHAQAAPMKQPWSSKEAALVDMQGQLLDQRADNSDDAVAAHKRV